MTALGRQSKVCPCSVAFALGDRPMTWMQREDRAKRLAVCRIGVWLLWVAVASVLLITCGCSKPTHTIERHYYPVFVVPELDQPAEEDMGKPLPETWLA